MSSAGVDPVDAERNEPTEGDPFCTSMSDCDVDICAHHSLFVLKRAYNAAATHASNTHARNNTEFGNS